MIYDTIFPTVVAKQNRKDLVKSVKKIVQDQKPEDWLNYATLNVHVLNNYVNIKKEFEKDVNVFLQEIMQFDCNSKITTSWITKTKNDSALSMHHHRNSWYSGCFYLQDNSTIEFANKNIGQIWVKPNNEHALFSQSCVYTLNKGTLVMFPSDIPHTIIPNKNSQKIRYSLAFNVMPVGEVGMEDSTYVYGG